MRNLLIQLLVLRALEVPELRRGATSEERGAEDGFVPV
jgi:hypothetical protein